MISFVGDFMGRNYDIINFFKKYFYFNETSKIEITFTKTTFKNSIKVKRITNYVIYIFI